MNKLGVVLGVAAVATLAGCKDPDYKSANAPSAIEVKIVNTEVAPPPSAPATEIKTIETVESPAPVAKPAPIAKPAPVVKPAEPETTIYIVQNGDFLAKISKRFNVTVNSIKRLNKLKSDMVRVGQKLKLPGKIDIGVQSAPVVAKPKAKTTGKKSAKTYEGATKEYVVKNGDTLGSIAYGNGINIRQLKALNQLNKDTLKVGQKLKIPAEKVVKAESKKSEVKKVEVKPEPNAEVKAEPAPVAELKNEAAAPEPAAAAPAADVAAKPDSAEAAPATIDYVVQDTDDITDVSIRFGVTAAEIRELNNLGENDKLVPGKVLKLPAEAAQQ